MRKSNTQKRKSTRRRDLELQVREYVRRYRPELSDCEVTIGPGGLIATVRLTPKTEN